MYLAYGPFPEEALCGRHLSMSDPVPEGETSHTMRAQKISACYLSLAHFLESCDVCEACQGHMADLLGYDSAEDMREEHRMYQGLTA